MTVTQDSGNEAEGPDPPKAVAGTHLGTTQQHRNRLLSWISMMLRRNTTLAGRAMGRRCFASTPEDEANLVRTALYDWHVENGGKMVPFAGYWLPVQYDGLGVLKEHLHTRAENSCSLFDVSHMGQLKWTGSNAVSFLERMTVGDIGGLKDTEAKLSLIMNEAGGIVDDTVITNAGDHIYMVVNGACKHKDLDHFSKYIGEFADVHLEHMEDQQLLALQGKGAHPVMERLTGQDLSRMPFMSSTTGSVGGVPCRITRCGYTGEDGFELSVAPDRAVELASLLAACPEVQPAGLGARDSLRLEAGLCLYGNDLDETTTPVEAGLVWTIGGPKSRRRREQGFLGAAQILEEGGKLKPVARKRVGIAGMKAPARAHTDVYSADGSTKIGEITSGGFGPSFKAPVAMGYVATEYASGDAPAVQLDIRGKKKPAEIVKMPFVPANYFKVA